MNVRKLLSCLAIYSAIIILSAGKTFALDVAIQGYDAVAYFNKSMAVSGQEAFSYEWNDEQWLFSNQENLDAFKGSPEKYAPQYHGMCAYAVSKGSQAPGDPQVWEIVDDKLYFNLNKGIQTRWAQDKAENIRAADGYWAKLMDK